MTDSPPHPRRDDNVLRTPSPAPTPDKPDVDCETGEINTKDDFVIKNAEELNREFLESLPKEEKQVKISVKPVEKLIEPARVDGEQRDDRDHSHAFADGHKFSMGEWFSEIICI